MSHPNFHIETPVFSLDSESTRLEPEKRLHDFTSFQFYVNDHVLRCIACSWTVCKLMALVGHSVIFYYVLCWLIKLFNHHWRYKKGRPEKVSVGRDRVLIFISSILIVVVRLDYFIKRHNLLMHYRALSWFTFQLIRQNWFRLHSVVGLYSGRYINSALTNEHGAAESPVLELWCKGFRREICTRLGGTEVGEYLARNIVFLTGSQDKRDEFLALVRTSPTWSIGIVQQQWRIIICFLKLRNTRPEN